MIQVSRPALSEEPVLSVQRLHSCHTRRQRGWLRGLTLVLLIAAGCVTREIAPKASLAKATLVVSRSGPDAHLQWKSDPSTVYTVLFAPSKKPDAQWKPMPGYIKIRGTGQMFTIKDTIPRGQTRYYRLHVEPALAP
jgi:hypothetical protein